MIFVINIIYWTIEIFIYKDTLIRNWFGGYRRYDWLVLSLYVLINAHFN